MLERSSGPATPATPVEELVRRHAGRLLAAARRLTRDEDEARHTLAQALEAAVRRPDRRPQGATLDRWLVRLLVETSLAGAGGGGVAPSIR